MVVSDFGSYTYIPTITMEDQGLRQVEWDFLKYYATYLKKIQISASTDKWALQNIEKSSAILCHKFGNIILICWVLFYF